MHGLDRLAAEAAIRLAGDLNGLENRENQRTTHRDSDQTARSARADQTVFSSTRKQ